MSNMERMRAVSEAKARIADFVGNEILDRTFYTKLLGAAKLSGNGSEERVDFENFLKKRSERLGLVPRDSGAVSGQAYSFAITEDGAVRLRLTTREAKILLQEIDTGKKYQREPLPTASWLARWPDIVTNRSRIDEIASISPRDSRRGGYVSVKEEDLWALPQGVTPQMRNGRLMRNQDGELQIYVTREAAQDAIRIMEGRPLAEDISATMVLLRSNPSMILVGDAVNPRAVIERIANADRQEAGQVLIDPRALLMAVDRQKDPTAMALAFGRSVMEARDHGLATRILATEIQASRAAESEKKGHVSWLRTGTRREQAGVGR